MILNYVVKLFFIIFFIGFDDNGDCIATVTKCDKKKTVHIRPVPMNTIELCKRASRFLRLGSEKTMEIAEKLYQKYCYIFYLFI